MTRSVDRAEATAPQATERSRFDAEGLYRILESTTKVFRKGEAYQSRTVGNVQVHEIFGYPHTGDAPKEDNFKKVDMVFVDVVVDKRAADAQRENLVRILDNYPQPERLAKGPSYIEIAGNIELEQDSALRLMALGEMLGLWKVVSMKTLGADDAAALEMAGMGFLMISGYRKSAVKLGRGIKS